MTFGVYIQVPFCRTKCTYCNFHTGVVSRDRFEPYVEAVCREIAESPSTELLADSVYFGGGTPSLLDPRALGRILGVLRETALASSPETTLEADPETVTPEKSAAWITEGFNRVSLGVQSFDDRQLSASGRMHRRADIFRAMQFLRAAGFRNVSMDLIAGLPHQTRESWQESVTELLRLHPEHVSIYMLEIDDGSRLGKESLAGGSRYGAKAIPSEDAMAEFYEWACQRLAAEGYKHYEISNWALPGLESRHNLKYWRREPYRGFGAGAHSFDRERRWANVHDSALYTAKVAQGISPREQMEVVTPAQALEEEFFLGLRQMEGIDLERIERDYKASVGGERFAVLRNKIQDLQASGLVECDGPRVRLAPARLAVSNEVFVELLGC
jgi:oxygen-independent coproporphyrinogen III oxidase